MKYILISLLCFIWCKSSHLKFIWKTALSVNNPSLKKTELNIPIHCLLLSTSLCPAAQLTGCGFGSFKYEMLLFLPFNVERGKVFQRGTFMIETFTL